MSNKEIFREIEISEVLELPSRWNFVPTIKYASMVPVENEIGSLVHIATEDALRSGRVDGATIERLLVISK